MEPYNRPNRTPNLKDLVDVDINNLEDGKNIFCLEHCGDYNEKLKALSIYLKKEKSDQLRSYMKLVLDDEQDYIESIFQTNPADVIELLKIQANITSLTYSILEDFNNEQSMLDKYLRNDTLASAIKITGSAAYQSIQNMISTSGTDNSENDIDSFFTSAEDLGDMNKEEILNIAEGGILEKAINLHQKDKIQNFGDKEYTHQGELTPSEEVDVDCNTMDAVFKKTKANLSEGDDYKKIAEQLLYNRVEIADLLQITMSIADRVGAKVRSDTHNLTVEDLQIVAQNINNISAERVKDALVKVITNMHSVSERRIATNFIAYIYPEIIEE